MKNHRCAPLEFQIEFEKMISKGLHSQNSNSKSNRSVTLVADYCKFNARILSDINLKIYSYSPCDFDIVCQTLYTAHEKLKNANFKMKFRKPNRIKKETTENQKVADIFPPLNCKSLHKRANGFDFGFS